MIGSLLDAIVVDSAGGTYAVSLGGELLFFTCDEALAWREAYLITQSLALPRPMIARSGPQSAAAIETLLAQGRHTQCLDQAGQVAFSA